MKAQNIIFADSILIIISTLAKVFGHSVPTIVSMLTTIGTVLVLISLLLCMRTIWTKWATELKDDDEIKKLRDSKTKYLHGSIIILSIALVVFVIMFIALEIGVITMPPTDLKQ